MSTARREEEAVDRTAATGKVALKAKRGKSTTEQIVSSRRGKKILGSAADARAGKVRYAKRTA